MPAQEAHVFKVQARSAEPHEGLDIPGGDVWVTLHRGYLVTGPQGEAAIRCLARDFDVKPEDTRLVRATPREIAEYAALLRAFGE